MFPSTARNHLTDGLLTDAKTLRKHSLGGAMTDPTLPNDANSFIVQLGVGVRRTVRNQLGMLSTVVVIPGWHAFLGSHISEVVEVCAEEQMIRTATRRVIAAVADLKPIWDRPIGQLIGQTMGCNRRSATIYPDAETAISLAVRAGSPYPALAGLVNPAPQADVKGEGVIGSVSTTVAVDVGIPVVTVVLADADGESASAGAKGSVGGRMILHDGSLRCATPGAVTTSARASLWSLYHAA